MEEPQYEDPVFSNDNNTGERRPMEEAKTRHLVVIIILLAVCLVVSTAAIICASVALVGKQEVKECDKMEGDKVEGDNVNLTRWNETDERLLALETALIEIIQQQQRILSSLQGLTSDVESYHSLDDNVVNCPSSYLLNPYSNTCIRVIPSNRDWGDAKEYCEAQGEYLATFETLESAFWFINLRKTNSAWSMSIVWLGGKKDGNGIWRWYGLSGEEMVLATWGTGQPDRPEENCVSSWRGVDYKLNDDDCGSSLPFVCELQI